ncbi:MAG: hypothetical protein J5883_08555 [Clostridiales bacterium]|nr:hypothetical protein [Clostridiales bacterium]
MKSLIVFFSRTGNTRKIADKLSLITGSEKEDVEEGKDTGDIKDYPVIFLLSPVWDGRLPGPVRSYVAKRDWRGKKIYPLITNGGLMGSIYPEIISLCKGGRVDEPLSVRFIFEDQKTEDPEIEAWAGRIMRSNLMF